MKPCRISKISFLVLLHLIQIWLRNSSLLCMLISDIFSFTFQFLPFIFCFFCLFIYFFEILYKFFLKQSLPINSSHFYLLFLCGFLFVCVSWFLCCFVCFLFLSREIFHGHQFKIRWLYRFLVNHTHKFDLFIFFIVNSTCAHLAQLLKALWFWFNISLFRSCSCNFIQFLLKPKTHFIQFFGFLWRIFLNSLSPYFFKRGISSSCLLSVIKSFWSHHTKFLFTWNWSETPLMVSLLWLLHAVVHCHVRLPI